MRLPRTSVPDLVAIDSDDSHSIESNGDMPLRLVDSSHAQPSTNGANGATHENGTIHENGAEEPSLRSLLNEVLGELRSQRNRNMRVVVKSAGKVLFLRAEQIEWVEAAGNYVRLHVGGESHLFRESMKNMESRLDGERFVRIHRSAIVNVDHIRELQPWFHGEYVVLLQDGTRLMASRVFSDRLTRLIA
jgi:DNA-binding LytR/AlgR family response regulator